MSFRTSAFKADAFASSAIPPEGKSKPPRGIKSADRPAADALLTCRNGTRRKPRLYPALLRRRPKLVAGVGSAPNVEVSPQAYEACDFDF